MAAPWKLLTALWTVYLVWGPTYLAIKISVRTLPALLSAGFRFLRRTWRRRYFGVTSSTASSTRISSQRWFRNAVGLALEARRRGELPEHLLPVYDLGEGTTYAIDFSGGPDGEHPVVSWHGDPMLGVTVAATDFGAFFLETLKIARASY